MSKVEILMPKMGESIMEATILTWLKKEGDTIEEDESLLEVATDKVDTEVPSTHGGVISEILAKVGDVVEIGKPIAIILTENGSSVIDNTKETVLASEAQENGCIPVTLGTTILKVETAALCSLSCANLFYHA